MSKALTGVMLGSQSTNNLMKFSKKDALYLAIHYLS